MLKKCFPAAAGLCLILFASVLSAAELRVGAAKADVTPKALSAGEKKSRMPPRRAN